jgi:riboflavin transporter FmnP
MTIAFAAVTVVLNPAISGVGVPFPPISSLIYNFWEIVIIAAFLLMGFKSGISVAFINAIFLFAVFPGPTKSIYAIGNTVAVSSMMLGIYLTNKFTHKSTQQVTSGVKIIAISTLLAMLLRVVVMAPIMYGILHYNIVPIRLPETTIINIVLPLQAIYNIRIALYTIPLGYFLAKAVSRNLKVGNSV